jgi:hypothetical protein
MSSTPCKAQSCNWTCSEAPRRSLSRRSLGAKRQAKTDPKLRRPYRRAKHGRRAPARTVPQCGRRSPSGDRKASGGSLPPRHFVAFWSSHVRSRSVGTPSTSRQEPLVLSRGDIEATRGVGPVGLVGLVGRQLRRTAVYRRGRRAPGRGTCDTTRHILLFSRGRA